MAKSQQYWQELASLPQTELTELFAADGDRLDKLTAVHNDIRFDFSKTHLDQARLNIFAKLAEEMGFEQSRAQLLAGKPINKSEHRAAEHTAERGIGDPESVQLAEAFHNRMYGLIDAIGAGAFGEIKHLLHIGIGGSALGPKFVLDALGRDDSQYDVAVVSNVDGAALEEVFGRFDPKTTMIAVASKTFTTTETMLNAQSALNWLRENGVDDPFGRVVALTASPDKALKWGVDETRILPFNETVGGRYSLWSSIGFPIAMALGRDAFSEFLEGAASMDKHFQETALENNIPVLAAFADSYYAVPYRCQTRAVFAYDERLRLLPDYLQQLEMESNGKSATNNGEAIDHATAPITWGGVGTDAQHAVFQLLHQGTHLVPVEFIASVDPGHDLDPTHHQILLTNCFAQGAALMSGKHSDDLTRNYVGNRPSTTILLDEVSPRQTGALLAFYEHRTFTNAVLLGINPFDQFGVELGKEIAKSIETEGTDGFDVSTQALIATAFGEE